jgi:hypothetical protein
MLAAMPTKPEDELEHFDPEVSGDDEGDELAPPSAEEMAAMLAEDHEFVEEVESDGFQKQPRPSIPQPDRARSSPDLPRVKSSSFKRFIT